MIANIFQDEEYKHFLYTKYRNLYSSMLGVAIFLYIIADLTINYLAYPHDLWKVFLSSSALISPLLIAIFILTLTKYYRNYFYLLNALPPLLAFIGGNLAFLVADPNERGFYPSNIGMVAIIVYMLIVQMPFKQFLYINLIAFPLYIIVLLVKQFVFHEMLDPILVIIVLSVLLTNLALGIFGSYYNEINNEMDYEQKKLIRQKNEKIDELMSNIFPSHIIKELEKGNLPADIYQNIFVLFVDIVDFTYLSSLLTPKQLVYLLSKIFNIYDDLVEKYALEKIKTIGDAYMIAGGLNDRALDPALNIGLLALEMQKIIQETEFKYVGKVKIRIGLHVGKVIAGVIGYKKLAYDIWGDTVNKASRMETHGVADKIQVTTEFYDLVQDKFYFEDRGDINVKGLAEVHTYFLIGEKPIKK